MNTTPRRIQRRRTKGWRMPQGAVYVGRPSRWGNPFRVGGRYFFHSDGHGWVTGVAHTRADAVDVFRLYVAGDPEMRQMIRDELAGRDLCCWCPPGEPCHADVLLEIANEGRRGQHGGDQPYPRLRRPQ